MGESNARAHAGFRSRLSGSFVKKKKLTKNEITDPTTDNGDGKSEGNKTTASSVDVYENLFFVQRWTETIKETKKKPKKRGKLLGIGTASACE